MNLSDEFLVDMALLAELAPPKFQHEADRLYRLGEKIYLAVIDKKKGLDALYQHHLLMEKALKPEPVLKQLNLTASMTTKKKPQKISQATNALI